jgi:ribose 1,5-bisphosphokinase PhnN
MSLDAVWGWCAEAATLRRTHLRPPPHVEQLLIVGATCVGKTTLGRAVRESAAVTAGRACLPVRYITRPKRAADCESENRHCSATEFASLVASGEIAVHWARDLEAGRAVRYGFPAVAPGPFSVYSANNALLAAATPLTRHALIVAIHAPPAVRRERMERRSPDLLARRPAEVAVRLGESSTGSFARAHVVVENHGAGERHAPSEFAGLVTALADQHAAAAARD